MFIDASAVVSLIAAEEDASSIALRLRAAQCVYTSPMAVYEATLGVARALNIPVVEAQSLVEDLLHDAKAEIMSITGEIGRLAIDAFERYGRGGHPARLNMGDCFAYACARSLGVPLLYKGEDFSQTDIATA